LHFEHAVRVVYKPKDLGLEAFVANATRLLTASLPGGPLRPVDVLEREGYGYAEFVASALPSRGDRPDLYFRSGALLAVLYILGASDCHYENVVVRGTELVLIDAETLLEGAHALDGEDMSSPVLDSVLRTGLLPCWLSYLDRPSVDIGGLSSVTTSRAGQPEGTGRWRFVNTDDMAWEQPMTATRPLVHDEPEASDLARQADGVCDGFRHVYEYATRPEVRAVVEATLQTARGLRRRVVIRPTRIYSTVQSNALTALALSDWRERAVRLDQLSRAYLASDDESLGSEEVLAAELQSLEDLDVPRFEHALGSSTLLLNGQPVSDSHLNRDGIECALARLNGLSEDDDLEWQLRLIRVAIHAAGFDALGPDVPGTEAPPRRSPPLTSPIEALSAESLRSRTGDRTWLTTVMSSDGVHLNVGLLPEGLYDGRAGVAVSLFAAGEIDLAHEAIAPLLRDLLHDDRLSRVRYVQQLGMGLTGVGGVLRALLLLQEIVPNEADWIDHANVVASSLTPETIARCDAYDLVGGISALPAPLAALWRITASDSTLSLLGLVGEALLRQRDRSTGAWLAAHAARPLCGLAHGASGFATALAEIAVATGATGPLDGVLSALDYERRSFVESRGWPDFRRSWDTLSFMHAWCHGSAGIALARSRLIDLLPSHEDRDLWAEEAALAVELTLSADPLAADHLCCGNGGRVAIARFLGTKMGRPDWSSAALEMRDHELGSDDEPRWRVRSVDPGNPTHVPGLMTGLAGIGMVMAGAEGGTSDWVQRLLI
jgi:type 2 lantibiotic biosynthesis protein LanM